MGNKKDSRLEIKELFMATAGGDFNRCFHGTIRRSTDENGEPVVYGKIKVGDCYIYSRAKDQWELGDRLDSMVLVVLGMGLDSDVGYSNPNSKISLI